MKDDWAYIVMVDKEEIEKCHRLMDLTDLLHDKVNQAYRELLAKLMPEVLKG